jgi:hypothetical protein
MDTETTQTAEEILSEPGALVVMFDQVELAFDEKVVLKNISFTLISGHTKIILGASGSGKSTILKIITGLLRADKGVIWVNGERVDQLTEAQMMAVRADLGMIFQEGALFDSLTVRENVGYKLYEESNMPIEEAHKRVEESGWVLGDFIDRMPPEPGRAAAPRRDRAHGLAASSSTTKRRPARSDYGDDGRRGDHRCATWSTSAHRRHASPRRALRGHPWPNGDDGKVKIAGDA